MRRAPAALTNQNLPTGWDIIMLVAAAIAYRAMMTEPVPHPEPVGQPVPIAPRRRALVPV